MTLNQKILFVILLVEPEAFWSILVNISGISTKIYLKIPIRKSISMKIMQWKKGAALIVALALTAGLSLTVFAAESEGAPQGTPEGSAWQNPFADVKEADWYYHNVEYAHLNGLFSGTDETSFSPEETMTRGMLVTVLYRMAGSPAVSGAAAYSDVAADSCCADAVSWAGTEKIVNGFGDECYSLSLQERLEVAKCALDAVKGTKASSPRA